MFSGKSAAKTFFSRLFEKDKVKKEEPELIYKRKRSQSLFAPNVSALLSGEHVGGIHAGALHLVPDPQGGEHVGDPHCASSPHHSEPDSEEHAQDQAENHPKLIVPVSLESADMVTDNQENISNNIVEEKTDVNKNRCDEDEDEDLEYLRLSCDRIQQRRATDFSQVSQDHTWVLCVFFV